MEVQEVKNFIYQTILKSFDYQIKKSYYSYTIEQHFELLSFEISCDIRYLLRLNCIKNIYPTEVDIIFDDQDNRRLKNYSKFVLKIYLIVASQHINNQTLISRIHRETKHSWNSDPDLNFLY